MLLEKWSGSFIFVIWHLTALSFFWRKLREELIVRPAAAEEAAPPETVSSPLAPQN
jgi:hypothetical protein